jgi:Predicted membrane protein (DUF2306)
MNLILRNIFKYTLLGLGLFFTFLMFKIIYPYFSFSYDVGFLLTKQTVLHIGIWRIAFYTHISSSLLVLLFGLFQFAKPIIKGYPKIHRLLGKMYIVLILFICAPSGLIMAFYANGGIWAKISFVIISLLWWYYTFIAYKYAIKRDFKSHLANMYRSYALTLSAITLRTYIFILPFISNLHGKEMYVFVSWVSWIPNLIIVEILIRKIKIYNEILN